MIRQAQATYYIYMQPIGGWPRQTVCSDDAQLEAAAHELRRGIDDALRTRTRIRVSHDLPVRAGEGQEFRFEYRPAMAPDSVLRATVNTLQSGRVRLYRIIPMIEVFIVSTDGHDSILARARVENHI